MSQEPLDTSFELPPRQPGMLARYPRSLKLAVTAMIGIGALLPALWQHEHGARKAKMAAAQTLMAAINHEGSVHGEDPIVPTDITAPALDDQNDRTVKLTPAPDTRLTEETALGILPRVSEDGATPWRTYARPFNNEDRRPRLAIVITGLGLSRAITDSAISQLPPTVTLAFDGEGPVVGAWISRARQDGHETLLEVPMEPFDYPRSDPGPDALLVSLPNSDNIARLLSVLRRASGYVGITTVSGSRFTTDTGKLTPVLQVLRDRGLMIVDARAAPRSAVTDLSHRMGVPVATVAQRLDIDLAPDAIAAALNDLEKTAILNGRAVGIVAPSPVVIEAIQKWAKDLPQRGVALAPVSAMVR